MTAITVATAARGRTHTVRPDGRTACGRPIDFTAGWVGRVPHITVDCARCSHVPTPRAVAAAEAPREAITVPVPDEDDDVMRCSMFGHEMVDGACEVCGQPDRDAALARTVADAALGTLRSNPGEFGAALAGLGFGEMTTGDHYLSGPWWRTEHESGAFRVIGYTDDGDRVTLIGWDPDRPLAKLEWWRVEFGGSTPQSVVLAAIANTVGVLPVTR